MLILCTGDFSAPFPEEANRVLADAICSFHFPPTARSQDVLLAEGHSSDQVWITGNTVIDALLWVRDRVANWTADEDQVVGSAAPLLPDDGAPFVLITGHRRESFGQGFLNICEAIARLAANNPEVHFVYPVHLNPNVQKPVNEILSNRSLSLIHI